MNNNNILIYKIGKDNCSSCLAFETMKKTIQERCPYPVLSIDYKNIDQLAGRILTIDGHTVKIPTFTHFITSFPLFVIYDKDTFVGQFIFKLVGRNSLDTFLNKVNIIIDEYKTNKL